MVKNLEMLRKAKGWSRQHLAELVGLELNVRRIYYYERSDVNPDIDTLCAFANALGVTVDYLIGRTMSSFCYADALATFEVNRFGERIRAYREQKGLSRKDVADAAHISIAYLSIIESSKKIPKLETAIHILNALGASADYAFMDSLISAGIPMKCNALQDQLSHLPDDKQIYALKIIESVINSL